MIRKFDLFIIMNDVMASKYLNLLANDKLLKKEKLGTGNYYVIEELIKILTFKK